VQGADEPAKWATFVPMATSAAALPLDFDSLSPHGASPGPDAVVMLPHTPAPPMLRAP
jgi:hypothetical protein